MTRLVLFDRRCGLSAALAALHEAAAMSGLELGKLLVISPHLDDAVFGCGAMLAKCHSAVAVTIFAGIPPDDGEPATPWDRACGFSDARQAMSCRRREDQKALEHLGARPVWLPFLDSQYDASPPASDIVAELLRTLLEERPDSVLIPMGLYHSDHELAHAACIAVRKIAPMQDWLLYEDAIYRRHAGLLQIRLARLWQAGITVTPMLVEPTVTGKQAAVRCYASQITALGAQRLRDTEQPESFWRFDEGRA
jgi:LmbE family N-acetylglucosaminyl deacetylase